MSTERIAAPSHEDVPLRDLLAPVWRARAWVLGGGLVAGLVALAITFVLPVTFTARTVILPPQQQQSAAASALANLGALAGLAGAGMSVKSPADQYVALMQSVNVRDRIVDRFKLMEVYGSEYREAARRTLGEHVRIALGKKDGLITVEVDDHDPKRAADIANQYIDELRRLTNELALTEAQQRRIFFEDQLKQTRDQLVRAQQALQASGFDSGALRAEPKAAAEGYAQLQAQLTAAQVRLQGLRRSLVETAPEVQQQLAVLSALRGQLAKLEADDPPQSSAEYVSRYREFKYQETLFELFSRQYEMARLDESREGTLIQVVDRATPPERKSKPKRAMTAIGVTVAATFLLAFITLVRSRWTSRSNRS